LKEWQPLCANGLCRLDILTEAEKGLKNEGFTVLTGIIQVASLRNGNGRIYPKDVLEREMTKYQKLISENRAYGECVEEGSRILTKDGWKDFRDLNDGEYIYTINMNTKKIELQKVLKRIVKKHDSYVYHFKNRNIDIKVTPNHQFFLNDRYGNKQIVTAEEIYNDRTKYAHSCIPKVGIWESPETKDYFTLKSVTIIKGKQEWKEKYARDLKIEMPIWMAFLGFYLAEGHCGNGSVKQGNIVCISQNEGSRAERFRKILSQFPPDVVWKERKRKNGKGIIFYTVDKRLSSYLTKLGNKYNKYIPNEIKMLGPEYLRILLDWFILGDGRRRVAHKGKCISSDIDPAIFSITEKLLNVAIEVFSVSKRLVEDLQEVALKAGFSGNIHVRPPEEQNGFMFGREVLLENRHSLYILHLSTTKNIYLAEQYLTIEKVPYNGNVYCVETPNATFYCEHNNKTFWSHNCDHSDKEVVELQNVSHMLIRYFWDNNNVMGVIKVFKTPKGQILEQILQGGGTLGISSRALGSLTETNQGAVVNEDLAIISFDIVSQPSAPGAYLRLQENQQPQQYSYHKAFSKSDRIYRALYDVLGK
jgi:hypothetical protein